MPERPVSPLTGSARVLHEKTIPRGVIVDGWSRTFGVDVSAELPPGRDVEQYRCLETGLVFFRPVEAAGSAALYERLQEFPWYYLGEKWEHQVALGDLRGRRRVMEVGCGPGWFVQRAATELGAVVEGIELNEDAVRAARKAGIPVRQADLADVVAERGGELDAACAFQVLEHVPDPGAFLRELVGLVRPGGLVIVSVPNEAGYLRHVRLNLLDLPPHHMSRWTRDTVEHLPHVLPVRVAHVSLEPLARYHSRAFLAAHADRLPGAPTRAVGARAAALGGLLLERLTRIRRRLPGHTLYACLERVD